MDAVLKEFLAESAENLDQFERDLVGLERRPDAHETLANAFRAIHSIKGATGFLGLSELGALAHVGESLLSALRERRVVLSRTISTGLLDLVDRIRLMLSEIELTGTDAGTDCAALIARLEELQQVQRSPAPAAVPATVRRLAPAQPAVPAASPSRASLLQSSRSVRVDVAQLDDLMTLVGELVLTRNEMLEYSALQNSPVLLGSSQRLNAVTTLLQDGIMKTRMQPIDNVWSTFPRMVRDLAVACGKQVRLELSGRETELDKTLLEAIKDPLIHVVRNCVDHGIETPERRLAAGKPAEGCLELRAFHEGGQVHIEVSDDGAGIDLSAISQKAVEHGLITSEQGEVLNEQDAAWLLFQPGFSTATAVTSTSGRGVGMDVVKTNIERIGGKVAVHSRRGAGTTLRIRIPLTLAIMPALVVTAGGDRFAIPQVGVLELIRLAEGGSVIQMVGDAPVLRLREEVLPLIRLDATLAIGPPGGHGEAAGRGALNVVILKAEGRKFGLVVDEVIDTQEIVVKPLDHRLRALSMFAGATIMGDGCVALILDVTGLAVHAGVLSEPRRAVASAAPAADADAEEATETLLAVTGSDDEPMAIPLSQVMRLEAFSSSVVERLSGRDVVQYGKDVLPLVHVSDLVSGRSADRPAAPVGRLAKIQTVVYSRGDVRIGLIVRRILDTVEHPVADRTPGGRQGLFASAVIHGRVTQILNLDALCARLHPPRAHPTSLLQEVAV